MTLEMVAVVLAAAGTAAAFYYRRLLHLAEEELSAQDQLINEFLVRPTARAVPESAEVHAHQALRVVRD